MSTPVLVPRDSNTGVFATWGFAGVFALVVAITVPSHSRTEWYLIGAGIVLLFAFVANMAAAVGDGFMTRMASATLGGVFIMGIIGLAVALTEITELVQF